MLDKPTGGFWAAFGKVSAVLTAVGTIVGIYLTVNPSGPELAGKCDYNSYALPPDLISALADVRQSQTWDSIREELKKSWGENEAPKDFPEFEVARHLSEFMEAKWPENFRFGTGPYRGFWYITIENSGNRIADDVVLDMPLAGIALITGRDEQQEIKTITKTVSLGALRPGDSVAVALWSEEGGSWADSSDFRLTHAGGTGVVSFPSSFYGFRAVVARNLGFISFMGGMAVLWAAVIVGSYVASRRGPAATPEVQVEEPDAG
jgi:hypothetical protein